MNEDRLGELLRRLPAERAPEDFGRRVLARLEDPRPRRGRTWLAAGVLAAAACGLLALLWSGLEAQRRDELRRELASLRGEARAVEQALVRSGPGRRPLLYLGGDAQADYVLDLGQVEAPSRVLPALLSAHGQGGVL